VEAKLKGWPLSHEPLRSDDGIDEIVGRCKELADELGGKMEFCRKRRAGAVYEFYSL